MHLKHQVHNVWPYAGTNVFYLYIRTRCWNALLTQRVAQMGHGTRQHLLAFDKINYMPKTLTLSWLDEGQGIETAFWLHKPKWHDSCGQQHNKTRLQRAEKMNTPNEDHQEAHKFIRHSSEHKHHATVIYFGGNASTSNLTLMCDSVPSNYMTNPSNQIQCWRPHCPRG